MISSNRIYYDYFFGTAVSCQHHGVFRYGRYGVEILKKHLRFTNSIWFCWANAFLAIAFGAQEHRYISNQIEVKEILKLYMSSLIPPLLMAQLGQDIFEADGDLEFRITLPQLSELVCLCRRDGVLFLFSIGTLTKWKNQPIKFSHQRETSYSKLIEWIRNQLSEISYQKSAIRNQLLIGLLTLRWAIKVII
jgi:hypothetical protein